MRLRRSKGSRDAPAWTLGLVELLPTWSPRRQTIDAWPRHHNADGSRQSLIGLPELDRGAHGYQINYLIAQVNDLAAGQAQILAILIGQQPRND
jgi:hypothetical protein